MAMSVGGIPSFGRGFVDVGGAACSRRGVCRAVEERALTEARAAGTPPPSGIALDAPGRRGSGAAHSNDGCVLRTSASRRGLPGGRISL
jgi:hypothetical protein